MRTTFNFLVKSCWIMFTLKIMISISSFSVFNGTARAPALYHSQFWQILSKNWNMKNSMYVCLFYLGFGLFGRLTYLHGGLCSNLVGSCSPWRSWSRSAAFQFSTALHEPLHFIMANFDKYHPEILKIIFFKVFLKRSNQLNVQIEYQVLNKGNFWWDRSISSSIKTKCDNWLSSSFCNSLMLKTCKSNNS